MCTLEKLFFFTHRDVDVVFISGHDILLLQNASAGLSIGAGDTG